LGEISGLMRSSDFNILQGHTGIAHTRWATHGQASTINAHPHCDCSGDLALVHNGIFENYHQLKQELSAGHQFVSSTDTEIVAHVMEEIIGSTNSLYQAAIQLVIKLQGAFACAIVSAQYPDTILAIRKQAPLCIGVGDEYTYVASDPAAFNRSVSKVLFIPEGAFALVSQKQVYMYTFEGRELQTSYELWSTSAQEYHKGEFSHFMLKEIYEQPRTIRATIDALVNSEKPCYQLGVTQQQLKTIKSVEFIGCGTSWHAARVAQFYFEQLVKIPVRVHLASEFRHQPFIELDNVLYIVISQSGETADTLEVMRMLNNSGATVIAISNEAGSTMIREASGYILTHAGKEIAVASTKAFSAQLTALYWFAHTWSHMKNMTHSLNEEQKILTSIYKAATILEDSIFYLRT